MLLQRRATCVRSTLAARSSASILVSNVTIRDTSSCDNLGRVVMLLRLANDQRRKARPLERPRGMPRRSQERVAWLGLAEISGRALRRRHCRFASKRWTNMSDYYAANVSAGKRVAGLRPPLHHWHYLITAAKAFRRSQNFYIKVPEIASPSAMGCRHRRAPLRLIGDLFRSLLCPPLRPRAPSNT